MNLPQFKPSKSPTPGLETPTSRHYITQKWGWRLSLFAHKLNGCEMSLFFFPNKNFSLIFISFCLSLYTADASSSPSLISPAAPSLNNPLLLQTPLLRTTTHPTSRSVHIYSFTPTYQSPSHVLPLMPMGLLTFTSPQAHVYAHMHTCSRL